MRISVLWGLLRQLNSSSSWEAIITATLWPQATRKSEMCLYILHFELETRVEHIIEIATDLAFPQSHERHSKVTLPKSPLEMWRKQCVSPALG